MMTTAPSWMPDMVIVDGDWNIIFAQLVKIFDMDFRHGGCSFEGRPIWWDRNTEEWAGGYYEKGFLHIITRKDYAIGERLFDPRRAERLPWCAPTICNASDTNILVWDYREADGKRNTYIWLQAWDYAIILQKRPSKKFGEVAFLITAFYVDGKHKREDLQRKYAQRVW